MKYPVERLERISRKIQELLVRYRNSQPSYAGNRWEDNVRDTIKTANDFMNSAGIDIYSDVNKVLGEIEALLESEDREIRDRVQPMLNELQVFSIHPTNPLGYTELSSKLSRLAGHLSVRTVATPKIFVGYRYTSEDEIIAEKFRMLFTLEGFNPTTGKTAKAVDINEKVKTLIDESEGVIIIFTRDRKLEGGNWKSSIWLQDEKAFAVARNKPILLFFDDGIDMDERKGIQGGLEYLEFSRDCLDNCILKAIPYLRDFRQRILDNHRHPLTS